MILERRKLSYFFKKFLLKNSIKSIFFVNFSKDCFYCRKFLDKTPKFNKIKRQRKKHCRKKSQKRKNGGLKKTRRAGQQPPSFFKSPTVPKSPKAPCFVGFDVYRSVDGFEPAGASDSVHPPTTETKILLPKFKKNIFSALKYFSFACRLVL